MTFSRLPGHELEQTTGRMPEHVRMRLPEAPKKLRQAGKRFHGRVVWAARNAKAAVSQTQPLEAGCEEWHERAGGDRGWLWAAKWHIREARFLLGEASKAFATAAAAIKSTAVARPLLDWDETAAAAEEIERSWSAAAASTDTDTSDGKEQDDGEDEDGTENEDGAGG